MQQRFEKSGLERIVNFVGGMVSGLVRVRLR